MQEQKNPYVEFLRRGHQAFDLGWLADWAQRDADRAITVGRHVVVQVLEWLRQAHAVWLEGYNLRGKKLRRAGTPFSPAYDKLERWLAENNPRRERKKRSRADVPGSIYVISIVGNDGLVKIGFSTNVRSRVKGLATSLPTEITLHLTIPGTMADERALHARFAADRTRGEWFRLSAEVSAFIAVEKAKLSDV